MSIQITDLAAPSLEALKETLEMLREMNGAARAALKGDVNPALLREANGTARAIATVSAEIRQREKHLKHTFEDMTPEERRKYLCLWVLQEATQEDRDALARALAEARESSSVLGG